MQVAPSANAAAVKYLAYMTHEERLFRGNEDRFLRVGKKQTVRGIRAEPVVGSETCAYWNWECCSTEARLTELEIVQCFVYTTFARTASDGRVIVRTFAHI